MEAVAPAPNRDSIVAEPPPQTHWLLPLIFVGGVGYAWHLWNQAAQGAGMTVNELVLTAIAIFCGPAWFFNGRRRVVVDRSCVSEYRGGKLLHRYPIRDIAAVRSEFNGTRLVFADRRAITIPNMWTGASHIRQRLQTVVDVQAGSTLPVDDWLPLNYLTFPPRCVSCDSSGVVEHRIFAGTNYTLPNVHVTRGWQFPVPACPRCSQRRKVVGVVTAVVLICGGIGLVVAGLVAAEHFPEVRVGPVDSLGVFFLVSFTAFLVITHMSRNQVPRWLDQQLLGVAALRLGKDKTTVRLWFRDRQKEVEVRTLTAENRAREMSSTAGLLRANPG
jgi:hypothetical protein